MDTVRGFDLSGFNRIVSRKKLVGRNDLHIELLTDDASAFFFDFVKTDRFPAGERKTIEIPVRRPGGVRHNPVDTAGDGRDGCF